VQPTSIDPSRTARERERGPGPRARRRAAQQVRRTVALVINGKAGRLLAARGGPGSLTDLLRAAGFDIAPVPPGALPDRLEHAHATGADLVVIAGGDGTIACAAQILANGGGTLGIIPAGTMNLLAKDLGIPGGDSQAAVDVLRNGTPRTIDAGDLNGHVFLCAAMFGAPARMGHHREEGRHRGNKVAGWLYFARASLRSLMHDRPLRLSITVGGATHIVRTSSLTMTVNALNDATGAIFDRARLDGGMLCIYVVQHRSVLDLVRLAFNVLRGRIASDPSVTLLQGKTVRIETKSEALRVLIDGEEHLVRTPLRATIMPGALRVIAPAG
jgi:diacylglycerol kinase family enzyme